jgi:hypothetical protein
MKQKPVAWIRSGDDQLSLVKGEDDGYMVWKPLYTSPHSDNLGLAESIIKQQEIRIAELEKEVLMWESAEVPTEVMADLIQELERRKFITTPQIKELSDEELNKAFDYYCETDEGVLRFNYELRDEWKKEQLIRWKEAFKKASEK